MLSGIVTPCRGLEQARKDRAAPSFFQAHVSHQLPALKGNVLRVFCGCIDFLCHHLQPRARTTVGGLALLSGMSGQRCGPLGGGERQRKICLIWVLAEERETWVHTRTQLVHSPVIALVKEMKGVQLRVSDLSPYSWLVI